jgi:hypothetical protein
VMSLGPVTGAEQMLDLLEAGDCDEACWRLGLPDIFLGDY